MASIDVVDLSGNKVGTFELAEEVFGAVNESLLWEAVNHYRAAQRAGTHATKNKKLVSGSGKKLWRQKGTGRARVGSVRSPIWRHGGTVHGPQPRSYDFAFPRKKVLGALRSALASKLEDGKLTIVEGLESASGKTKDMRKTLDTLGVTKTALLVASLSPETAEQSTKLVLSTRNLDGVELVAGNEVHPYHLLRYERAIFSRPAIERLQDSLKKSASKRRHQEVA
jgi:large subunit ribosomal protein L4